jgi:hypothetical protein
MPILESALGIENAYEIADASERVSRSPSASRTTPPTSAW